MWTYEPAKRRLGRGLTPSLTMSAKKNPAQAALERGTRFIESHPFANGRRKDGAPTADPSTRACALAQDERPRLRRSPQR
jgi:hypothetical protein